MKNTEYTFIPIIDRDSCSLYSLMSIPRTDTRLPVQALLETIVAQALVAAF